MNKKEIMNRAENSTKSLLEIYKTIKQESERYDGNQKISLTAFQVSHLADCGIHLTSFANFIDENITLKPMNEAPRNGLEILLKYKDNIAQLYKPFGKELSEEKQRRFGGRFVVHAYQAEKYHGWGLFEQPTALFEGWMHLPRYKGNSPFSN